MAIDFSSFKNAIAQLEKALSYAHSPMAKADPGLREQLRNSVIQCFEFTYELSHKMLKRHLESTAASPEEIDQATFQNLIRTGNEKGLLRSDWETWRTYRQARTDSNHTYDQAKAEAVFALAPAFLEKAQFLAAKLTIDPTL
ncbi:MAG: HI0074 family nucleotidyltransferase substrate-binding subunit [Ideonella sp.]|nr:HI0074 family nucleotidyltransferase substrate-binding subunit [Ideonella sp.]